jgi:hypothetical protein
VSVKTLSKDYKMTVKELINELKSIESYYNKVYIYCHERGIIELKKSDLLFDKKEVDSKIKKIKKGYK